MLRRLIIAARRFARAERGATAVEFGLISVPLVMLICGTLELSGVFLAMTTVDTAVETASRTIRTGTFQHGATPTKAGFKTLVCNNLSWLSGQCGNLYVETRTFASYAALAANTPVISQQPDPAHPLTPAQIQTALDTTCFTAGQPGDIVLVRIYYRWNLFTPGIDVGLANAGPAQRLITSTTAFRNEPFDPIANPPATQCS